MDRVDSPLDACSKVKSQRSDRYGSDVGILLSRYGSILDYECASDGMDGCTLVDEFLDCHIGLVADYSVGSGIIGIMGWRNVSLYAESQCN